MAIHITNPGRIAEDINEMHAITSVNGKNVMNEFANIINSLNRNWIGTDAVKNLRDLSNVYAETAALVKKLHKLVVEVNDYEIVPLLLHIEKCGGDRSNQQKYNEGPLDIADTVTVQTSANESKTLDGILTDAENFNLFPNKFNNFTAALISAKEKLFSNWKEGANKESVEEAFKAFETNVINYKRNLESVKENLNIVATNKKQFLNAGR